MSGQKAPSTKRRIKNGSLMTVHMTVLPYVRKHRAPKGALRHMIGLLPNEGNGWRSESTERQKVH